MIDHWIRVVSVGAWLFCLACMAAPALRLIRGRGRHLDPIWAIVLLLSVNRLSFLLHVSSLFSLSSALVLALVLARFSLWYQHRDA